MFGLSKCFLVDNRLLPNVFPRVHVIVYEFIITLPSNVRSLEVRLSGFFVVSMPRTGLRSVYSLIILSIIYSLSSTPLIILHVLYLNNFSRLLLINKSLTLSLFFVIELTHSKINRQIFWSAARYYKKLINELRLISFLFLEGLQI